jgi:hypothetical protein
MTPAGARDCTTHQMALDTFREQFDHWECDNSYDNITIGESYVKVIEDSDDVKVQTIILYGVPKERIVQLLHDMLGPR